MQTWMRTALGCTLVMLAMTGCASLSERQCRAEDWYQIGFSDGVNGARPDRVSSHGEACAKYSIQVDSQQYEFGRRDGLIHYCTTARGLGVGQEGMSYTGVCEGTREADFIRGWRVGRQFHEIDARLASIDSDMRMYRNRLSDKDLDDTQRRRIERVYRDLSYERSRLEADRRQLEWELPRLLRDTQPPPKPF